MMQRPVGQILESLGGNLQERLRNFMPLEKEEQTQELEAGLDMQLLEEIDRIYLNQDARALFLLLDPFKRYANKKQYPQIPASTREEAVGSLIEIARARDERIPLAADVMYAALEEPRRIGENMGPRECYFNYYLRMFELRQSSLFR